MRAGLVFFVLVMASEAGFAQQRVIYDDDCSQDVDCVATLPILYSLEDRGEVQILATVADSADPFSAPVMRVFAKYAGHPKTLIGANQTNDPATALCAKNQCNESVWAEKLLARFDPGDTRAKYPECVAVYRRVLAKQPDHSVDVVVTGFATCLNQLLASPADAVSPLGGAALVKQKVKLLSVMGGRYPSGIEWNFECDAPGFHELFANWTRQHGYPPVYLNGFANGEQVLAGSPRNALETVNPTRYGLWLAGTDQRPMWDMLSVLFAARGAAYEGTTYFSVSVAGTAAVDAVTGADTWSEGNDSGQYVITNAATDEVFSQLFDGYKYKGFLAHEQGAKR
jgi:hypothetical protein